MPRIPFVGWYLYLCTTSWTLVSTACVIRAKQRARASRTRPMQQKCLSTGECEVKKKKVQYKAKQNICHKVVANNNHKTHHHHFTVSLFLGRSQFWFKAAQPDNFLARACPAAVKITINIAA